MTNPLNAEDDRLSRVDRGDTEWRTIPGLLAATAQQFGDREAIIDGENRLTWADVAQRSLQAARAFVAAGVEPGDRVSIWAPNTWEWVVALMGLHSAGAVLVPLNTRFKGSEAAYVLGRSRAKVLLTVEGFLGNDYVTMLDQAGGSEHLTTTVVMRGTTPDGSVSWDDFLASGDDVDPQAVRQRLDELTSDDLSDIMFTSGTTGAPKGVMCTHGQTLRGFTDWAKIVGLRSEDRYLVINPFFHSFGYKAGIVSGMAAGCTLVPQSVFDVNQAVENIKNERISMIPGPPTLYQTILNHPDFNPAEIDSLRLAVTGAAAVPVELITQMREVMGFETVVTAYGLTEACGIATVCRADDPAETISTTSGRAIPGVEVRIVDDEQNELTPGEAGEVVIRGYNVMLGYFESPEQTAETIDADGWLHTGDIGVMNADGYLQITDRKKDMFIVGGFNAYPAEIENALSNHPAIAQVSVVGVPDDRMGEVGYAFVVPKLGSGDDRATLSQQISGWARENMANYKVPRTVEIIDALPTNASGKVLKYELRDRAVAALDAARSATGQSEGAS